MQIYLNVLIVLLCYALGCMVTAWYLVKWRTGEDLRGLHSGTTGARNAGRVLGKGGFGWVALVDVLRGLVAVWAAGRFGLRDWWAAAAGAAVLLGHIWPVQLNFQGGKGVAVGAGVLVATVPFRTIPEWTLAGSMVLLVCWCHRSSRQRHFSKS